MRLDRVYVDGFKNLNNVEIDFDESRLTTVIIGQNGTGKSNLIEAIASVFRYFDTDTANDRRKFEPRFSFEVDYKIGNHNVRLAKRNGQVAITVDGGTTTRSAFDRGKSDYFPDLVFGYYSGGSRRLEKIFDYHQKRYYEAIKTNDDADACRVAHAARRLFYCRPIHGVLALLSFFANPTSEVTTLLRERLGVTGFHSALALMKEPWFAKGGQAAKLQAATNVWGAKGPAGACARKLRDNAFHPISLQGNAIDDYRDKLQLEAQLACFVRDHEALHRIAAEYENDQEFFAALEAADISDLFRDVIVWVTRTNDTSGDVGFADLSDGERQLLMVLGLIRISRHKRALFLLDEPDTHLNPAWQHSYLELIQQWTQEAAVEAQCQIVMTSHNPLTIAGLEAAEVRMMTVDAETTVSVRAPHVDPRGLGFAGVLTDVFGMPSTLDRPTQKLIDERNKLAAREDLSPQLLERLDSINNELRHLGFLYEERDKLYGLFLKKLDEVELADVSPLTSEEMRRREDEAHEIVAEILDKK